jgi:hypothetical protein
VREATRGAAVARRLAPTPSTVVISRETNREVNHEMNHEMDHEMDHEMNDAPHEAGRRRLVS